MKQIIVTKCQDCGYVHNINYDENTCYCESKNCNLYNVRFEIPTIQLELRKTPLKEIERLYNTLEHASPEMYRIMDNLAQACMWSEESFKIVKSAHEILNSAFKNSDGVWK